LAAVSYAFVSAAFVSFVGTGEESYSTMFSITCACAATVFPWRVSISAYVRMACAEAWTCETSYCTAAFSVTLDSTGRYTVFAFEKIAQPVNRRDRMIADAMERNLDMRRSI
jgi:hypothetical protein